MAEFIITYESDKPALFEALVEMPLPYTATIRKGKHRSLAQNRLQFLWMREASEQLSDHTPDEYRAYCKLHFGVPILRGENEEFCEGYDRIIQPLNYEDKLKLMAAPFNFPVTRLMRTGQKKRYLDDVYMHFTGLGVKLTEPDPW